jgi:hypothetical protein
MTLKLILFSAVFYISQISAGDRIVREDGDCDKDSFITSETGETYYSTEDDTAAVSKAGYDDFSLKEKWDAPRYLPDFSGSYTERYVASIKIDGLLGSGRPGAKPAAENGLILIGFKRPYYRLDRDPRLNGRVDLQMSGSIFGIENAGLISFSYDLRGRDIYRRVSTSVSFYSFIYRITIPLGPKR